MKTEDKFQILKLLIMLVNSFFVILGISLFGCSAWILFDKSSFISVISSEENVKVVAGGLFVIGLVVVGVSMLGCIGVHMENRCFIAFYMGLLITIVLGQVFVTFLLLFNRTKIERILNESVDDIIKKYGGNDSQTAWTLLDSVQKSAQCCGRNNAGDWKTNALIQNMSDIYPCTCFNDTCPLILVKGTYTFGNGSHIYTMGCGEKLNNWFESNVFVIVGIDLGLLVIQILQFALGIHIYRTISLKMQERHSRSLLSAAEQNISSDTDAHHSDQEHHQPNNHTFEQQLQKPYDQQYEEHVGQSYNHSQDQHYQIQGKLEPNSRTFVQKRNNAYDQEDAGQSYGQYEHQHYQHNDNVNYPQTSNGLDNKGYNQNDDLRNNYY